MKDDFLSVSSGYDLCDIFGENSIDNMPLAASYVPMQRWRKRYEPDVALSRGTIFVELDLPFLGAEGAK